MSRTRRLLCVFYGLIALVALIMTWSENLLYFQGSNPAGFGQYLFDLKVNGAARSFTIDIGLFFLAATGLMAVEARKIGMKFVWLYVLFGFLIAISVSFPLFLIAREIRLAQTGGQGATLDLTPSDIAGVAITAAIVLGMCGFILT
jgi:Protein of unknown function DUF2834